MLTLIAKNIGQGNGASLSALDVLISLGQIDPHMALIYLYKNNIPKELDGKTTISLSGKSGFELLKVMGMNMAT